MHSQSEAACATPCSTAGTSPKSNGTLTACGYSLTNTGPPAGQAGHPTLNGPTPGKAPPTSRLANAELDYSNRSAAFKYTQWTPSVFGTLKTMLPASSPLSPHGTNAHSERPAPTLKRTTGRTRGKPHTSPPTDATHGYLPGRTTQSTRAAKPFEPGPPNSALQPDKRDEAHEKRRPGHVSKAPQAARTAGTPQTTSKRVATDARRPRMLASRHYTN